MTEPIFSHASLADPGKSHAGAQLDCVTCFNELSTVPSTVQDPYDPNRPHLMLPPGRTVQMQPPTHPDEPSEHVVWSQATPAGPTASGGQWMAGCSCGWRKGGTYARNGAGEAAAGRLARLWASRHRDNPLGTGEGEQ